MILILIIHVFNFMSKRDQKHAESVEPHDFLGNGIVANKNGVKHGVSYQDLPEILFLGGGGGLFTWGGGSLMCGTTQIRLHDPHPSPHFLEQCKHVEVGRSSSAQFKVEA